MIACVVIVDRKILSSCSSRDPSTLRYIFGSGFEEHSVDFNEGFSYQASVLVSSRRCRLTLDCSMHKHFGFKIRGQNDFSKNISSLASLFIKPVSSLLAYAGATFYPDRFGIIPPIFIKIVNYEFVRNICFTITSDLNFFKK